MNFVICDDDETYAMHFINELKKLENIYKEKFDCIYYRDIKNLKEKITNATKADIYFIDIEFGDVIGMDVARIITNYNKNAGIVYITNYEEYAIKAFVCRPIGFIRKKHKEDINITMDKVVAYVREKIVLYKFMNNKSEKVINLATVLYLQMSNHNMKIYISGDCIDVRDKLSRVEKDIVKKGFIKINRSCLVNMNYINNINEDKVILTDGTILYISGNKQSMITREWQAYVMGY